MGFSMSVNEMSIRCLQFLRTHTCIYVLNILFQIIELNITIWIKRAFYFGVTNVNWHGGKTIICIIILSC